MMWQEYYSFTEIAEAYIRTIVSDKSIFRKSILIQTCIKSIKCLERDIEQTINLSQSYWVDFSGNNPRGVWYEFVSLSLSKSFSSKYTLQCQSFLFLVSIESNKNGWKLFSKLGNQCFNNIKQKAVYNLLLIKQCTWFF